MRLGPRQWNPLVQQNTWVKVWITSQSCFGGGGDIRHLFWTIHQDKIGKINHDKSLSCFLNYIRFGRHQNVDLSHNIIISSLCLDSGKELEARRQQVDWAMGAGKQSVELQLILVMIGFSGRSPSFAIIDLLNQFTTSLVASLNSTTDNCKLLQNCEKNRGRRAAVWEWGVEGGTFGLELSRNTRVDISSAWEMSQNEPVQTAAVRGNVRKS